MRPIREYTIPEPPSKEELLDFIEERSHKYSFALFERKFPSEKIFVIHERNHRPLLWHLSFGFLGNKKAFEISSRGFLRIFDHRYSWVAGAFQAARDES